MNKELFWLYTHCRAIGMDCHSESDAPEHNIALFTMNQKEEIEQLRARVETDAKNISTYKAMLQYCYDSQMKQLVKPIMQFDEWLWNIGTELNKAAPQQEQEGEGRE